MKKVIITAGLVGSLFFASQADAATHTVKSGDLLWKIAYDNNTTAKKIMEWNQLSSSMIYPGQILTVSEPEAPKYTVQAGDTLYLISLKFQTSTTKLISMNPQLTNPNMLYIGQILNVPATQTKTAYQLSGQTILNTGKKYIGAGYLYGASTDRIDVFDCSSFIKRIYGENGVTLPRVSADQANAGTTIPFSQAKAGDIVAFDVNFDGRVDHTGIYVDANTILHSSSSKGVAYSNTQYYWKERMVKVTRII